MVKELIQRIELQCFKCPYKWGAIETPIDYCLVCKVAHEMNKDKSWLREAVEREAVESKEN